VAREPLCLSYDGGQPPSEAFMERPQDITPVAKQDAGTAEELSAAFVSADDIDSVAQAIRDNHGCVLGVRGSNNGTWLSQFPQPPASTDTPWFHWIYAGKAKMINGKKFIGIINSWGTQVGVNGWQWLGEEYFNTTNVFNIWTMIVKATQLPGFKHNFTQNIKLNDRGVEVTALQQALTTDGEFHYNITGFYGFITQTAVIAFQKKYSIDNQNTNGTVVGPLTREKLNELFNY
jgi:hypothetical protein